MYSYDFGEFVKKHFFVSFVFEKNHYYKIEIEKLKVTRVSVFSSNLQKA